MAEGGDADFHKFFPPAAASLLAQLTPDDCTAIIRAISKTYFEEPQKSRNSKVNGSLNLENGGFSHAELGAIQSQLDEYTMEYANTTERLTKVYQDKCRPLHLERYDIVSEVTEGGGVAEPYFWLSALKAHNDVKKRITEQDLLVLEYLRDIRCYLTLDPANMDRFSSYKLEFIFDPSNPYFSNTLLTKVFHLVYKNGCFVGNAEGTTIHWNKDINLALESLGKKRKWSNERYSFFNLFETTNAPREEDGEHALKKHRKKISHDFFSCGKPIMQEVIPLALTLCGYSKLKQRKAVKKLRKKGGKEVTEEGGSKVAEKGRKVAKKGGKEVTEEGGSKVAKKGKKVAKKGGSKIAKEGRSKVTKDKELEKHVVNI